MVFIGLFMLLCCRATDCQAGSERFINCLLYSRNGEVRRDAGFLLQCARIRYAVPAGIVAVAVDGEEAVKVVVK